MTEPVSDKKVLEEATKVTPQAGDPANPAQPGQPAKQNPPVVNSGIDEQIKVLTEKIDTLSRQYDGSTKEALRLKEENDSLKKKIEEAAKGNVSGVSEEALQKMVSERGLLATLEHFFGSKVSSLEKRVEGLLDKESKKILEDFKSSHKGLADGEVFKKFEAELMKLQGVYEDINVAMEKAYVLIGGKELESKASPAANPDPAKAEEIKKANEKILNSVIGAADDKRSTPPVANAATLQEQINKLSYDARVLESAGHVGKAMELHTKIEDLRAQLGAKV